MERVRLAFDEHPIKPRARSTNIIAAAAGYNGPGDRKEYDRVFDLEATRSERAAERKAERVARPRLGRPRKTPDDGLEAKP